MINALLEGSLPPQLSALDPAMPLHAAPVQSANGNVKAPAEGMLSLGSAPFNCYNELHRSQQLPKACKLCLAMLQCMLTIFTA